MNQTQAREMIGRYVNRYCGTTADITATIAQLNSAARRYSKIQERWCNEEMTDATRAKVERTEAQLEASIQSLVQDLPQPEVPTTYERGQWRTTFQGDPRGRTVYLTAPDGRECGLDD